MVLLSGLKGWLKSIKWKILLEHWGDQDEDKLDHTFHLNNGRIPIYLK